MEDKDEVRTTRHGSRMRRVHIPPPPTAPRKPADPVGAHPQAEPPKDNGITQDDSSNGIPFLLWILMGLVLAFILIMIVQFTKGAEADSKPPNWFAFALIVVIGVGGTWFVKRWINRKSTARSSTGTWKKWAIMEFLYGDNYEKDRRNFKVISFVLAIFYLFVILAWMLISIKNKDWKWSELGAWYDSMPWLAIIISFVGLDLSIFFGYIDRKGAKYLSRILAATTVILTWFAFAAHKPIREMRETKIAERKAAPYLSKVYKAAGANGTPYPRITEADIYAMLTPEARVSFRQHVPNDAARRQLIRMCWAENVANFDQFNADGTVVIGKNDGKPDDVGICQINVGTWYDYGLRHFKKEKGEWEAYARKHGYDIYTLDGNIKFAAYLFKTEGTVPWRASRDRWYTDTPGDSWHEVQILTPENSSEWTEEIPYHYFTSDRKSQWCIDWYGRTPYEWAAFGTRGNIIAKGDWENKYPLTEAVSYMTFRTKPPAQGAAVISVSVRSLPPKGSCDKADE